MTLILIAVVVLDPLKCKILPWLIAGSLGSGMIANLLKLTIHRFRPRDFDLTNATVWDTFRTEGADFKGMQSMPSAHTATAVGLAVMLSAIYPRGRWYFAVLAILVGLQRVVTSAHFPSDVCAGAAVGCLFGMISCLSMKPNPTHAAGVGKRPFREVGFRSHLLLEGNYHRMFDVRSLNDFRAFLLPQWSVWLIERFVPAKS